MTNVTIKQLNEQTLLVKPEFHIISGRKKLRQEDLRLPSGVVLPPEQLASLGSKKFINPEEIARFNRLRDQAHTSCEKCGVKFLGGYAIPLDKVDDIASELDEIVTEFNSTRSTFLQNYDDHIESWCNANPEWEEIVRRSVTPKASVAASLSADYVMFQLSVPDNVSSERLQTKISSLGSRVFDEIAKEAQKFIDESMSIKTGAGSSRLRTNDEGVTQKALRPIRRMREKMAGLAFLDSAILPAVRYIDAALAKLPEKGRIQDEDFQSLLMLSLSLSDSSKIKQLGQMMSTFSDADDGFDQSDVFQDDSMPVLAESPTNLDDVPVDSLATSETVVNDAELETSDEIETVEVEALPPGNDEAVDDKDISEYLDSEQVPDDDLQEISGDQFEDNLTYDEVTTDASSTANDEVEDDGFVELYDEEEDTAFVSSLSDSMFSSEPASSGDFF